MICATVATQSLQLIGCDTMHHAQDLLAFPCQSNTVEWRMTVDCVPYIDRPSGCEPEICGEFHIFRQKDGRRLLIHEHAQLALSFDDAFSCVQLLLREDMAKRDVFQYLYTSHSFFYHLLACGGCGIHSAGVQIGSAGICLAGHSGVGKSTMVRHLTAVDPSACVLCEDVPAVMPHDNEWWLYGTPFCGEDTLCCNRAAPLRGFVLLRQGDGNRLWDASPEEAAFGLLSTVLRPTYAKELCEIGADLALTLSQDIPVVVFENDGSQAAGKQLMKELALRRWIL